MKKTLLLILLWLPLLFLWACSLTNNDVWTNTWSIERITQLEEKISGLIIQFSWFQAENEILKEYLSWAVEILQTLKSENEILETNVDKYKKIIVEEKLNSNNWSTNTDTVDKIANDNNLKQNIAWNRYNSSIWFSLMLPGKCFNNISQWWFENVVYHWIENLNYLNNNDVRVQCFLPNEIIKESVFTIRIHDYECDSESNNQWKVISIWNKSFTEYNIIYSLEWTKTKCYKTLYKNKILRFSFENYWENSSMIENILESLNDPI